MGCGISDGAGELVSWQTWKNNLPTSTQNECLNLLVLCCTDLLDLCNRFLLEGRIFHPCKTCRCVAFYYNLLGMYRRKILNNNVAKISPLIVLDFFLATLVFEIYASPIA